MAIVPRAWPCVTNAVYFAYEVIAGHKSSFLTCSHSTGLNFLFSIASRPKINKLPFRGMAFQDLQFLKNTDIGQYNRVMVQMARHACDSLRVEGLVVSVDSMLQALTAEFAAKAAAI